MIVRGPEFWGLDLIVSMGAAYAVVLVLAAVVAAVRRSLLKMAAMAADAETTPRSVSRGG